MRTLRLILILLIGGLLTYLTCQTEYQTFFFESFVFGIPISVGLLLLWWVIYADIQLFRTKKQVHNFALSFLCLLFITTILILKIKIDNNFNRPTLLRVFYDGDFNGEGIDFKTDGTYIYDNSAIGVSDYSYGTYTIDSNRITIGEGGIKRIRDSKYLELKKNENGSKDGLYLFHVDRSGNIAEKATVYRVVIDNRK